MSSQRVAGAIAIAVVVALGVTSGVGRAQGLTGAIFTTDSTCTGTNINIYSTKDDVYLNGGPAHPGAAGLPDGAYYIKVTEPDGTPLGTSVGSANQTPITVSLGTFTTCYELSLILIKNSDGTQGYDDTTNPGGEYKVWISDQSTFPGDDTKTDNFKVKTGVSITSVAVLHVIKFYDANADGVENVGEQELGGWRFRINETLPGSVLEFVRDSQVNITLDPGEYLVNEYQPTQTNWRPTNYPTGAKAVLLSSQDTTVRFGNVCLGSGGGLTLGFWSNKNGQNAQFGTNLIASTLAFLTGLNLRNADGSVFDPTTYTQFRTWILGATATNMANMLSAQLAAMELNVRNGNVAGAKLVFAPGAQSANPAGFTSITSLMSEANNELGVHWLVSSGSPYRTYQEALKTAIDKANNDQNFVQALPCGFSFP
jgi:hypothetical protein